MKEVYLLIFIISFFSCKSKDNNKLESNLENFKTKKSEFILEKKDSTTNSVESSIIENIDSIDKMESNLEPEYLSETKLINNKYSTWGERDDLEFFIAKADSVNENGYECGYVLDDNHEIWYHLNNEIEVSKTDYVFRKIDFHFSNYTLKYKGIVFSKEYTLVDFKKNFPFSFLKNKVEEGSGIVTVNIASHPLADGVYIFKFKKGKLIELYYLFPC